MQHISEGKIHPISSENPNFAAWTEDKLTTLFESDDQLYFCIGLIILVGAIVIVCAMVNDYREYLDAHLRTRFRLKEFLREEKFYFFLFFAFVALIIFIVVICTKLAQA